MANLATCPPLTRESVFEARKLIQSHIHKTPVLTNKTLSLMASTPRASSTVGDRKPAKPVIRLWFKCENMQRIGAFKARGAFHAIERLKLEPGWLENGGKSKGVVGFSAGNHAQALALAARENGITAHIVMPSTTRPYKIDATKGYGANVVVCGPKDREAVAAKIVSETGARLVPPFDHPGVILGQATVGLEMQDQIESLDAVIAPCSGGGLLSGVALSCEGTGRLLFREKTRPWDIIYERRLVGGMYAVSEEEILEATKLILERLKLVVEPAAAVPLAVALFNEEFRAMVEEEAGEKGWDLGLVLSGGNIGVDGLVKLFC
ncbi:hypothetical protein GQ607_006519 [Colletotrichum asianum]|uniref:Tryptophan synthase beta chain-like PALP domain-containing protein n=1 Tax=Colletotrichum asianum TaxID=702518 RepID=A0A8H3WID5_9PEZI|nr:hypothetical protein GQ607_006519 [Colletotrichum asianum]